MKTIRTSVEIPEDLYDAFRRMGGVLSVVVRDAIRDYLGIKGASEDALAVLELKYDRLTENKLKHEGKVQELESTLGALELQMKQIKAKIQEKEQVNEQARIMREEVNPYLRNLNYEIDSITPELHEMLLKLREVGLDHTLESLQKHAVRLENSDYLRGGYRNL